jgi:hypothetical protein
VRYAVCRLPTSSDRPWYFILDTVTFNVVRELAAPHAPMRFETFITALGRARKLNERVGL